MTAAPDQVLGERQCNDRALATSSNEDRAIGMDFGQLRSVAQGKGLDFIFAVFDQSQAGPKGIDRLGCAKTISQLPERYVFLANPEQRRVAARCIEPRDQPIAGRTISIPCLERQQEPVAQVTWQGPRNRQLRIFVERRSVASDQFQQCGECRPRKKRVSGNLLAELLLDRSVQ
jgi:hypothetical protein